MCLLWQFIPLGEHAAVAATSADLAGVKPKFAAAVAAGLSTPRHACVGGRTPNLLADQTGFALAWRPASGGAAGTTGGEAYKTYVVRNTRDTDANHRTGIPGSLRAAVTEAAAAGGGWIIFDPIKGQTVILDDTLYVPSNVTIDGGCQNVTISNKISCTKNNKPTPVCTAETCDQCSVSLLVVKQAHNVVISNLRFQPDPSVVFAYDVNINPATGKPYGVYESGDCVSIASNSPTNEVNGIWIAHNTFESCHDGLLDINQNGYDFANDSTFKPTQVTIAFNYFYGFHGKDIGIGTGACQKFNRAKNAPNYCTLDPTKHAATLRKWNPKNGIQVTFQGNLFFRTSARHPHTSGVTYAHMVDNVIGYEKVGFPPTKNNTTTFGPYILTQTYGTYAGGGSRIYGNNNFYLSMMSNGEKYFAIGTAVTSLSTSDGYGATRMTNNFVTPTGTVIDPMANAKLVDPPAAPPGETYAAIPAKLDFTKPWSAVTCLAAHIGAGSSFPPLKDPCPAGSY